MLVLTVSDFERATTGAMRCFADPTVSFAGALTWAPRDRRHPIPRVPRVARVPPLATPQYTPSFMETGSEPPPEGLRVLRALAWTSQRRTGSPCGTSAFCWHGGYRRGGSWRVNISPGTHAGPTGMRAPSGSTCARAGGRTSPPATKGVILSRSPPFSSICPRRVQPGA